MNWLLIIVVIVLILFAYKGRKDGFIKTVFSVFSIIIAITLATIINPYVGKALKNNENIFNAVEKNIEKLIKVENEIKQNSNSNKNNQMINSLNIPKSIKKALIDNANSKEFENMAKESIKKYVSYFITGIVINAIAFVITLIVVSIVLYVIGNILNIVSKLPVINGLNKTAGLFVGIFEGLIVIWLLCILLTAFSATDIGSQMYKMINESVLLEKIYDNNLLLKGITTFTK